MGIMTLLGAGSPSQAFNPLSLSPALFLSPAGPFFSDLGTTLVTTNGSAVRRWGDLSGFGRHADAPSDAARPILRIGGGKTWLQFDGVDDVLQIADFSSAFAGAGTTCHRVQTGDQAEFTTFSTFQAGGGEWHFDRFSNETNGGYLTALRSTRVAAVASLGRLQTVTVTYRSDAGGWQRRLNGTVSGTAAAAFAAGTQWTVGATWRAGAVTSNANCLFAALAAYTRYLTDPESLQLETWMGGVL